MKVKHLYTAGDGYCANGVWPMWSQILAEILDCEWTNLSQVGAGNEVIAAQILDELANQFCSCTDTLWLIQWTQPNRLDLQNPERFTDQISQDPVYYKNYVRTALGHNYWCSSASTIDFVTTNNDLIPITQHQSRSRMFQLAVAHALDHSQATWKYLLTYPADWREQKFISESSWLLPSLKEFRSVSQYLDLDIGYIQPVSSVHLDWLEQKVLPMLDYDSDRFESIRKKYLDRDQNRLLDPGFYNQSV